MFFSLVIPTCNRPEKLSKCLDAVFMSDYARERYEVIVVIDGKVEKYRKLIDEYRCNYTNLVFINQIPQKGPAAARNLGIQIAHGLVVGFTDDDCLIAGNWISKMVEVHADNPEIAAVGGETLVRGDSLVQVISQTLATNTIQAELDGKRETVFFPTCNVALKKSVLKQYRFDENFPLAAGEDLEYFWRLYKSGLRFIYDKSITVMHNHSPRLKSFIRQQYNYGKGNLLVYKLHPDHPALRYLSLDARQLLKSYFDSCFNFYGYLFWQKLRIKLMEQYNINHFFKWHELDFYLALHRLFNFLGSLRTSLSKKFKEKLYVEKCI